VRLLHILFIPLSLILFNLPVDATDVAIEERILFYVESRKLWCAEQMPGFQERSRAGYKIWRGKYGSLISKLEKSEDYAGWLEEQKDRLDQQFVNDGRFGEYNKYRLLHVCNDELIEFMGGPAQPNISYSTPTKTWNLFVNSVNNEDLDTSISCLESDFRDDWIVFLYQEGAEKAREYINTIKSVNFKAIDEKTVKMVTGNSDGSTSFIEFKLILGNWKIVK